MFPDDRDDYLRKQKIYQKTVELDKVVETVQEILENNKREQLVYQENGEKHEQKRY